tara:strand:+ start:193 stop:390 length:198 start_codon:yes stop_codon:yes gene_type:complete
MVLCRVKSNLFLLTPILTKLLKILKRSINMYHSGKKKTKKKKKKKMVKGISKKPKTMRMKKMRSY